MHGGEKKKDNSLLLRAIIPSEAAAWHFDVPDVAAVTKLRRPSDARHTPCSGGAGVELDDNVARRNQVILQIYLDAQALLVDFPWHLAIPPGPNFPATLNNTL